MLAQPTSPLVLLVQVHCLTRKYAGLARVIQTPVEIFNTITGAKENTLAIWDTGATGSAITKSLSLKLGLVPVTQTIVKGVHGVKTGINVVPVKIVLNSQVSFTLPVTECDQLSDDDSSCFLLGMDVISKGDFALSNVGGQTVMTFRTPSIQRFDFVEDANKQKEQQQKPIDRKTEIKNLYKAKPKKR
jgi:hypothetical protein